MSDILKVSGHSSIHSLDEDWNTLMILAAVVTRGRKPPIKFLVF